MGYPIYFIQIKDVYLITIFSFFTKLYKRIILDIGFRQKHKNRLTLFLGAIAFIDNCSLFIDNCLKRLASVLKAYLLKEPSLNVAKAKFARVSSLDERNNQKEGVCRAIL
jgi:hypothetical protein